MRRKYPKNQCSRWVTSRIMLRMSKSQWRTLTRTRARPRSQTINGATKWMLRANNSRTAQRSLQRGRAKESRSRTTIFMQVGAIRRNCWRAEIKIHNDLDRDTRRKAAVRIQRGRRTRVAETRQSGHTTMTESSHLRMTEWSVPRRINNIMEEVIPVT